MTERAAHTESRKARQLKTSIVYATFMVSILIIGITSSGVLGKKPSETPGKGDMKTRDTDAVNNNGKAIGKNKQNPDKGSQSTPPPEATPPPDDPVPPPPEPIIEINLYTDQECNTPLTSVDWGQITAGTTSSTTMYLKNEGDMTVNAQLQTENWTPSDSSSFLSLSWDYSGEPIYPDESVRISLRLDVNGDCPTYDNFNFDIIVVGS